MKFTLFFYKPVNEQYILLLTEYENYGFAYEVVELVLSL